MLDRASAQVELRKARMFVRQILKVFCFFSSEKKAFLLFYGSPNVAPPRKEEGDVR
jgi:hypothetical protein